MVGTERMRDIYDLNTLYLYIQFPKYMLENIEKETSIFHFLHVKYKVKTLVNSDLDITQLYHFASRH